MSKRTVGLWILLCGAACAGDTDPRLLWSTKVAGLQQGNAAVADGQVFAPVLNAASVVSLDAVSGKVRWTRALADTSPYPPIIDQDSVYVITGSCTLYKLSRTDGKVIWTHWLSSSIHSMPTLAGGRIFAASMDTTNHVGRTGGWHLVCIDSAKGKELWSEPIGGDVVGAPLVTEGNAYVCTQDGTLRAFDAQKGRPLWKSDVSSGSMPAPCGDWLVTWSGQGLSAVQAKDGKPAWSWIATQGGQRPQTVPTAPVAPEFRFVMIAGERAYVTATGPDLTCLDLSDRSKVWTWSGGEEWPGEPVMVAGRVYFGTSKGTVVGLNAESGKTLWAVKTDAVITDAPAVMDGTIYFHDAKGAVVALDAGTPDATGWGMWGGSPSHTGALTRTQPANVVTPSAGDGGK